MRGLTIPFLKEEFQNRFYLICMLMMHCNVVYCNVYTFSDDAMMHTIDSDINNMSNVVNKDLASRYDRSCDNELSTVQIELYDNGLYHY